MGLADGGGRLGDLVLWGLFIFTVFFFSAERLIELLLGGSGEKLMNGEVDGSGNCRCISKGHE